MRPDGRICPDLGSLTGMMQYHHLLTVLSFLSKAFGNLGYQNFHQRTLSASSKANARIMCLAAAGIILIFAIPPILMGAVAASTGI